MTVMECGQSGAIRALCNPLGALSWICCSSSSCCCCCCLNLLLPMSLSGSSGPASDSPPCCCIPLAKNKVCFHFDTVGHLKLDILSAYPVPVHCSDMNFFLMMKCLSTKGVVLISIMAYETIVLMCRRQGCSFICSRLSIIWPGTASTEPRQLLVMVVGYLLAPEHQRIGSASDNTKLPGRSSPLQHLFPLAEGAPHLLPALTSLRAHRPPRPASS